MRGTIPDKLIGVQAINPPRILEKGERVENEPRVVKMSSLRGFDDQGRIWYLVETVKLFPGYRLSVQSTRIVLEVVWRAGENVGWESGPMIPNTGPPEKPSS